MGEVHVKLGKLLKLERERRNLSLAELSADLKISEINLQHIEDGNPSGLPGDLYFNLFGRSYAEALGIDFAMTMDAIREDLGESIEPPNGLNDPTGATGKSPGSMEGLEVGQTSQSKPKVNIGSTVTIILLAIVAVVIWFWVAPDKKVMLFEKDRAAGNGKEKSASELADSLAADTATSFNLNLKLVARDRAWATVLADGDTALATTLKPWREYTVGARDTLLISLASPLSVDAFVNGQRTNLRDTTGAVEKVVVTLGSVVTFVNAAIADSLAADSARADSLRADSIANDSTGHGKLDTIRRTAGAPRVTKADSTRRATEPADAGSPLVRLRKADTAAAGRDSAGGR
jgi:hypothetical protein